MPLTFNPTHIRIGIIGLGYGGLPLAVEFARKYPVVGFDVKQSRIEELGRGEDNTREVGPSEVGAVVGCHPEAPSAEGSHRASTWQVYGNPLPTPYGRGGPRRTRP